MTQEFYDHDTPSEADLDLCYGSKFLSATELGDKKIRTRILKVNKAPLRGQDGKEKNKFILSFSNVDKGLVDNATNIKTLVDAVGKAPSGWLHADVGIFTEPTMMAGKPTRGVQRVPTSSPKTLGILFVRSLPIDFNSYNRLSRPQNGLDNIFDLLCDVRNRFAYRPSNMLSDGNTADFSQMVIYQ
jgi:hypothetical protein